MTDDDDCGAPEFREAAGITSAMGGGDGGILKELETETSVGDTWGLDMICGIGEWELAGKG